jgi:hypothetical protein
MYEINGGTADGWAHFATRKFHQLMNQNPNLRVRLGTPDGAYTFPAALLSAYMPAAGSGDRRLVTTITGVHQLKIHGHAGSTIDLSPYFQANAAPLTTLRLPTPRTAECQVRDGQDWFAAEVTKNYGGKCAVTGATDLLDAAHWKPWAIGPDDLKLNPQNGLLLCRPVHNLFDAYYWAIGPDGRVLITRKPVAAIYRHILDFIDGKLLPQTKLPPLQQVMDWRLQAFLQSEADHV